jgi:hypothetical protein
MTKIIQMFSVHAIKWFFFPNLNVSFFELKAKNEKNILQLICNYHKPCEFLTWDFIMKCPLFPWNKYNIIAHQLHQTCSCKTISFLWTQFLIVYTSKYNNKASNHNGEVIEYDSI